MTAENPEKNIDLVVGYLRKKITEDRKRGRPVPENLESFFFAIYTYAEISLAKDDKEVTFFLGPVRPLEGGSLRQRLEYGEALIKNLDPAHVFLLYSHRTDPASKSVLFASAPPESYFDLLLAGEAARRHKREIQILKKRLQKGTRPSVQLISYGLIGRRCRQVVDKVTERSLFLAHDGYCGEALSSVLAMCGAKVAWRTFPVFALGCHIEAVAFFNKLFGSSEVEPEHPLLCYTAKKVLDDLVKDISIPPELAACLARYPSFNNTMRKEIEKDPDKYAKCEDRIEEVFPKSNPSQGLA